MNAFRAFRHAFASCALGLALSGCGHMPVTSMVRLARLDLTSTDPVGFRAAVRLPAAIKPLRDRVRLRIAVKLATGKEETQDFRLTELSDPAELSSLRSEIEAGTKLFAFGLDPAEAARLTAFRDDLKKRQAESGGRGGAITISIAPEGCRVGELAPGAVLFTTYLRTAETGDYVPLARDVDMREIAPGRDLATEMPLCGRTG